MVGGSVVSWLLFSGVGSFLAVVVVVAVPPIDCGTASGSALEKL
jgi:hypothetical protein